MKSVNPESFIREVSVASVIRFHMKAVIRLKLLRKWRNNMPKTNINAGNQELLQPRNQGAVEPRVKGNY